MPRGPIASGIQSSDAFPADQREVGAQVAAHAFDHTVDVQRNTVTGADSWGGDVAPTWAAHLTALECLGYTRTRDEGEVVVDGAKTASIEGRRVLVPHGTDITVADRLGPVMDGSRVVLSGPMYIEAVQQRAAYTELIVKVIE